MGEHEETARTLTEEYDAFLRELGWIDWSGIMTESLQRPPTGIDVPLPMRERILRNNIRRYGIYNSSRQLAVDVMARTHDYLISERDFPLGEQLTREPFVKLIVRMLQLQPNNPPVELPAYINRLPSAAEREQAAYEYDLEIARKNLIEHIQEVVSDLLETAVGPGIMSPLRKEMRGEELSPEEREAVVGTDLDEVHALWSRVEKHVSAMMHVHYLEPYFGQTPFLGEALLACAFKYALHSEDTPLLVRLYQEAARSGLNIMNHIGVTNEQMLGMLSEAARTANERSEAEALRAAEEVGEDLLQAQRLQFAQVDTDVRSGSWIERTDSRGRKVRLNIENGDILVYRSRTKLAGEIGFAAMPSWRNWRGILRHRLYFGSLTGMLLHLEDDAANDGLDAGERLRAKLQHKHWLVPGYNHTGTAKIFKSPSGFQQHRAVDVYPDGGIRIVGINQFAHNGPQMRFAVVKADPNKLYRHMQRYRAKHGYAETAWTGYLARVDEQDGFVAVQQTEDPAAWPTTIGREEYEALHDGPGEAGETPEAIARWKEDVNGRMVDHIIDRCLLDWGVHFATGFINVIGGLYCAQTPVVAMRQAVGIDLETYPDHFSLGARLAKLVGAASDLPTESRIVAPSGTYVQPFQTVHGVNFMRVDPLWQAASENSPRYVSFSPGMRAILYDPAPGRSANLIDEGRADDDLPGYFGERADLIAYGADSLRTAVTQIQQFAGFDRKLPARLLGGIKDAALWVMGW